MALLLDKLSFNYRGQGKSILPSAFSLDHLATYKDQLQKISKVETQDYNNKN